MCKLIVDEYPTNEVNCPLAAMSEKVPQCATNTGCGEDCPYLITLDEFWSAQSMAAIPTSSTSFWKTIVSTGV